MIAAHAEPAAPRSVWSTVYQGRITLWVEDSFTEEPLRQLWQDSDISLIAAGGTTTATQLTFQATPKDYKRRVFALVDRDFGADNYDNWSNPDVRKLIWPAHEFENLLLDLELLAAITGRPGMDAAGLRQKLHRHAQDLRYWLACRALVEQVRKQQREVRFREPVQPPAPSCIGNRDAALALLGAKGAPSFWTDLSAWLTGWDRAAIEGAFDKYLTQYEEDLKSDAWLLTFPGKELLTQARVAIGLNQKSDTNHDLALRIVEAMKQQPERIPRPVLALHAILRAKAGLPPKSAT